MSKVEQLSRELSALRMQRLRYQQEIVALNRQIDRTTVELANAEEATVTLGEEPSAGCSVERPTVKMGLAAVEQMMGLSALNKPLKS